MEGAIGIPRSCGVNSIVAVIAKAITNDSATLQIVCASKSNQPLSAHVKNDFVCGRLVDSRFSSGIFVGVTSDVGLRPSVSGMSELEDILDIFSYYIGRGESRQVLPGVPKSRESGL